MPAPATIPNDTALAQIGQIAITAHDVDRATAFYRDVLGLRHLFRAGQLSFFDCGGVRLMLDKPEFDHPSSILYFRVADIQATRARLAAGGARFVDEPHVIAPMPTYDTVNNVSFRDSEDNLLALMSEVPR